MSIESTLLQSCIKNDRQAQRQLFEANYSAMMMICMRYAKNAAQAKEMLIRAFSAVCSEIQEVKKDQDFQAWLNKTVIESAVSFLRERRQEYYITTTVRVKPEETAPAFDLFHQQFELDENSLTAEHYIRALQALPPSFRAVYNLCVIDKLSMEEVARLLETSKDTCTYNLSKAKHSFSKNLQQQFSQAA